MIAGAAADGLLELAFLRGTEAYETHWANASRATRQLRAARATPRGLAWRLGDGAAREAKAALEVALPPEAFAALKARVSGGEADQREAETRSP